MEYYYLGFLLETYYNNKRPGYSQRAMDDRLNLWALDMLEADYSSPALLEAACGFNWEKTDSLFEAILTELHIVDDPSAIDDDFIDNIFIEEYKHGVIASGCELLFHRGHLREKINFPYYVYHGKYYPYGDSGRFKLGWHVDEVPDLHTDNLERFVTDFLRKAGITR